MSLRNYRMFCLLAALIVPHAARAADIKYVVAEDGAPAIDGREPIKRIYLYGGYNFHMANGTQNVDAMGGMRGGPTGGIGFRFAETFRAELAFENPRAKYDILDGTLATGYFGFANIIMDAKLLAEYRLFKTSPFVPFVGFGAGAGAFDIKNGGKLQKDLTIAYNFIGGISVEINRTLALALTYKYMKALPDTLVIGTEEIKDFAPGGHNVGLTFRMNF